MKQSKAKRVDCVIIGGGIAGLETAINLGDMGYHVLVVEKEASIGGKMILLSKVFPTLDCASCIATPKMAQAANHPRLTIWTYTRVKAIERSETGGFKVRLRREPTYVDPSRCTGCGQCEKVCTVGRSDQFQEHLVARRAIYIPFPQAVPKKAVIEKLGRSPCVQACPAGLSPHGFVALMRAGKPEELYSRALEDTPFPGTLAYLCPGYCEARCTKGRKGAPLPVRGFVLFAAQQTLKKESLLVPKQKDSAKRRVIILGNNFEALAVAYFLAQKGVQVELKSQEGWEGLVQDKVPLWLWQREWAYLEALGIKSVVGDIPANQELRDRGDLIIDCREKEGQETLSIEDKILKVAPVGLEPPLAIGWAKKLAQTVLSYLRHDISTQDLLGSRPPESPEPLSNTSFPSVFWDLAQAQERAKECLDCAGCSACHQCVSACPAQAIDFSMQPEEIELDCGAVVLATGFRLYDPSERITLGYLRYPNVITGMQLDRLLAPTRPYNWLIRPSDGKLPGNIAIVLCVGSRDITGGTKICSRICCMYSIKQAQLIMGALPIAEITIYYIDIRAFGKGYEEFFYQAQAMGVHFVRGKVARIEETSNQDLFLYYEDLHKGRLRRARHDLVVLATGALPQTAVVQAFKGQSPRKDPFAFIQEKDPLLEPGQSSEPGVFVAGAACGPKDIPDTVVHAGSTAAQVAAYLKGLGW